MNGLNIFIILGNHFLNSITFTLLICSDITSLFGKVKNEDFE